MPSHPEDRTSISIHRWQSGRFFQRWTKKYAEIRIDGKENRAICLKTVTQKHNGVEWAFFFPLTHYQKGDKNMLLYSYHLISRLNSICMFHIYVKTLPEAQIVAITTPYSTVPWAVTIMNIIQKHISPFVSKREGEGDERL